MSNPYPLNPWSKVSCVLGVVLVLLTFSVPSHSAIFKWKDENGKIHFTDSLSKIPPQYRKKGDLKTMKGAPAEPLEPVKLIYPEKNSNSYSIPVKPINGHFIVEVQINGNIKANLMVDTGASLVILSEKLGERLGVRNKKDFPSMSFSTAGGKIESPLFVLDSLKIGEAEVFGLEASTNPNFKGDIDGLLGMSFLGEFKVEIDRENSQMLLKPTAEKGERLWGGHNEFWWRNKYQFYVQNMQKLRHYVNKYMMTAKEYHNSRMMIAHYSKLHEALDKRADQVNLPKKYRSYP